MSHCALPLSSVSPSRDTHKEDAVGSSVPATPFDNIDVCRINARRAGTQTCDANWPQQSLKLRSLVIAEFAVTDPGADFHF